MTHAKYKESPLSDINHGDMSLWVDEAGNRKATIALTFALQLPRSPQTAKAYLALYAKSEWIHHQKLLRAWTHGLKALARTEKESK